MRLSFHEMGKRTVSSRLVKASYVVAKNGQKTVGVPIPKENLENQPSLSGVDFLKEAMLEELALERERAEQELIRWRAEREEEFQLQLEEEKRRGYEEGYQLGITDGRQHALNEYRAKLQMAADLLEQAYQKKAEIIKEADPFVIELTLEIAKKVLQQELKSNPDELIHMINQILASAHETASISIGVAAEDFPFVQKQREQLIALGNGQIEIKVFPDFSVQEGGCIIRTSSGSFDARIDVQLSEIKQVLHAWQQENAHEKME